MALNPNIAIPSITDLADNHARSLQQSLAAAGIASGALTLEQAHNWANDTTLSRSNVNVQAVVTAMGVHGLYRWLRDFIARQAVPIWATGEFLDGWLLTYSMARKSAVGATGLVMGTGIAGAILPIDSIMQSANNQMYRVTADAVVGTNGVVNAQVLAMTAGAEGNLTTANTPLALIATTHDIDSNFTAPSGLTGGSNTETDAQAVYRLVQRLANEPRGGAPADYARWALNVAGITRAWGVRNPSGATSAGVIIMADGNIDGLPSEIQKQAVYDYIRDPKRGPPDELFVIIPTIKKIDLVLDLTPDSAAIRQAVMLELQDLFYREAEPAVSMPHTHLIEAVSMATGEYTHAFVSPELTSGSYFIAGDFEILALGSVTFI